MVKKVENVVKLRSYDEQKFTFNSVSPHTWLVSYTVTINGVSYSVSPHTWLVRREILSTFMIVCVSPCERLVSIFVFKIMYIAFKKEE